MLFLTLRVVAIFQLDQETGRRLWNVEVVSFDYNCRFSVFTQLSGDLNIPEYLNVDPQQFFSLEDLSPFLGHRYDQYCFAGSGSSQPVLVQQEPEAHDFRTLNYP